MKNKRLGEMLVDAGILSEKQIEEAIALQKNSGKRLGTILLENNSSLAHEGWFESINNHYMI